MFFYGVPLIYANPAEGWHRIAIRHSALKYCGEHSFLVQSSRLASQYLFEPSCWSEKTPQ